MPFRKGFGSQKTSQYWNRLPKLSIWPSNKPNEVAHHNKALMKDTCVMTAIIYTFFYFANNSSTNDYLSQTDQDKVFSNWMVCGSVLNAIAMVVTFMSDMFLLPYAAPGEPKWQTISIIGHCGFFTLQTLFLQTSYSLVKAYAIYTRNIQLVVVCYAVSLWVNTQGTALTILFFKLNWYEPKWQRDIQKPQEAIYPGISFLWLLGHVPSLPIAIVDALFFCNGSVVALLGAEYLTVVKVAFLYGFFYFLFTKLVQWYYGTLIYPFIKDISTPLLSLAFVVIVGTAVSGMGYVINMLMLM